MTKKFLLSLGLLVSCSVYSQNRNLDYKSGAINVVLPKTPESQGFEKYGAIPINEATGTANISIPVYNLKSRFLEVPITLSYSASGIKVNQEASWVGLGFDLIAGGRITVDVKGCIDNDGITPGLFSKIQLDTGMTKIFKRLGDSSAISILTYATPCDPFAGANCDTGMLYEYPDRWHPVNAMAEFGLGEPDIFNANFLGQSLKFYFDKISGELKFLNEKSHFRIDATKDPNQRISDWTVTDNIGVKYFFGEKEKTEISGSPYTVLFGASSTTAWLLTKIIHPAGDSILFSYADYGKVHPAFSWSASDNSESGPSGSAYFQDSVIQYPKYLSKIESNNATVEFSLGSREDLRGVGSRRLNDILIREKQPNTVIRKIHFSYDYFSSTQPVCHTLTLNDSLRKYSLLRLKLDKLYLSDSAAYASPYKFYYNSTTVPDKYSFSQDHWGFYNGAVNNSISDPCSPLNLIPAITSGLSGDFDCRDDKYFTFISRIQSVYNANRNCSPQHMATMSLDSIMYPTGGSSKLFYEPHEGVNGPNGAGLRLKTKKNYSLSRFAGKVDYTYEGGVFMGTIRYQNISFGVYQTNTQPYPGCDPNLDRVKASVSANGYNNENEYTCLYQTVIEKHTDSLNRSNGYIKKVFKATNPMGATYSEPNCGFRVIGAHWPLTGTFGNHDPFTLYPQYAPYPPTPRMELDGKLSEEQVYDSSNNLIKSTNYYYTQADYSRKFYSIRVTDNRIWHGGGTADPQEMHPNGARRYTMFVSPAKSYFTLTDSVIEKLYHGANVIATKKQYKYNQFYQPEFETVFNSDGSQDISYTKTLGGISDQPWITYPITTSDPNFYDMLMSMRLLHVYDLPIEQTLLKRSTAGDTLMIGSRFTYYKPNNQPFKTFAIENSSPLPYRTGFKPAYYSWSTSTIKIDSNYKIQDSAIYSAASLLNEIRNKKGYSAFIWDDLNNHLLAQSTGATATDIAYSSFEVAAKGNWTYSGTTTTDYTVITGNKFYKLAGGNISKTGLNASGKYIVSYWSRSGQQTVNNTTTVTTGRTVGNWIYYEHDVTNPASGTITVSGSGEIDELRLYPKGALMISYSYKPVIGISGQCDANNRISYYQYDALNRLALIRDQDNNILKKICYNFAGIAENCNSWGSQQLVQTFTRSNSTCATDYAGTTGTYTVPANKYFSAISPDDANAMAQADMDLNGQNYVNTNPASGATCIPMVKSTNTGTVPYTVNFTNTATSVVSSFSAHPLTSLEHIGQVAPGTYNVQFVPDVTATSQITLGGTTQTGGTLSFNNVVVNAPVTFTINPFTTGSCSISMFPGYTTPTNSFGNDGTNTYFYIVFYRSSDMTAGNSYTIGTISTTCRPSATRTIPYSTGGRTWTITITTGGQMIWYLHPGSPTLFANSTVSTSTLNYPL